MHAKTAATSALLAALVLAACGGGDSESTSSDTAGPAASTPDSGASIPDTTASTPEAPASTASEPTPPASTPEPPASTPETPASTPETPASTPEPPASAPTGADGSYSDKTTHRVIDLDACPRTASATLDLDAAHRCLAGSFWGAQSDPTTRALLTGTNSPYACKLNVIPPSTAPANNPLGYHFDMAVPHTVPSPSHPEGEYIETHISMSPTHGRNLALTGFTVTQNSYARTTENGDEVIRLDWSGEGLNANPAPFEKTGTVTNAIHLEARKSAGASVWRMSFVIHDSYTPSTGLSCVSTIYK